MSRPPLHYRISRWFERFVRRIGDAWAWLVGPIERAFGRVGESLFGAFDSFDGFESLVVRLVRGVFWPVTALFGMLGRLLPQGMGRGPSVTIQRMARGVYQLAERLNLDGVLRFVGWLLKPIWRPLLAVLGFANAWLSTRKTREVLLAAPAVLFALPFAYVGVSGAMLTHNAIAERYKISVRDATAAGDYDRVELFERKLAQLGVDTRRGDHRTAIALADGGDLAAAYSRMRRLAPEDRPGYPSAHLWIAQSLLSEKIGAEQEPRIGEDATLRFTLAEQHLDQLDALEIANPGIAQLKAFVYAQTGRQREAAEVLKPYAEATASAAIMRMRLLAQVHDLAEATDQARDVIKLTADPRWRNDAGPDDYSAWALAAELLQDRQQMEIALQRWQASEPENPRPRDMLAGFRRSQAERLLASPTTAPVKTAEVLASAAALGSSPAWITEQISLLARQRRSSHYAQQVWDRLIRDPKASINLVESLAIAAASSGEIVAARDAFVRLIDEKSESPVVWNNYAWVLLQKPEPNPPAALEAVEKALRLKPNDFRFRETRGQVYLAMSRWDEAIDDLEYALNGLPESAEVHRSLATAYEALDKPLLADIHRRHADR